MLYFKKVNDLPLCEAGNEERMEERKDGRQLKVLNIAD